MQALPRERLDALMEQVWAHRLSLLVAPAGSGKTTLLAHFAGRTSEPVAWYRAESWDGTISVLLSHLESAFSSALGGLPRGWHSVEDAARALETWRGPRAVLVIDDLHTLQDSAAEQVLERLLDYAPATVRFLFGSRTAPNFNLSRLRLSGDLLELGSDDLRFRAWEVERLFRDFYQERLPPEELAELARRTEGWAAGLQLFHLAARGKPAHERRRLLSGITTRSRLTHEYLTRNVLQQMPGELRDFLVGTCVLGRLSGPLCDALLSRTGSQQLLQELERRQVFTYQLADAGWYRYHEVLRSHLEQVLLDELGEVQLRVEFRRGGRLLESFGLIPEAVQAYSRAEDWEAVDRVLQRQGNMLVDRPGMWIDALPPAVLRQDPWLLLASARRHRAEGRWQAALESYHRAEEIFGSTEAGLISRGERVALAAWLDPAPLPATDWAGILRRGISHDPMSARPLALQLPEAPGQFAAAVLLLLAGKLREARRELRMVGDSAQAPPALATAARVLSGIADLLAGDERGGLDLEQAAETAEHLGLGWLSRLARAGMALSLRPGTAAEADGIRQHCERIHDRWGAGMVTLVQGCAALYAGDEAAAGLLDQAAGALHVLGAGVLEAWARGMLALAQARGGLPDTRDLALQAEHLARHTATDGPRYFAFLALAECEPPRRSEYLALADAVRDETGLKPWEGADSSGLDNVVRIPARRLTPSLTIRCFGSFGIAIRGRVLDLAHIKPRPRAVLRMLAVHAGNPVHREVLQAAFWPDADAETAARNLHVAISVLRQTLEPGISRGAPSLLRRDGDAYRLDLPADAEVDLLQFSRAVAAGRLARVRGDLVDAAAFFQGALELQPAELLPEDGPAEWVLEPRERFRAAALEAAQSLGEIRLERGEWSAAVQACTAGLAFDRYHDPLWRLLAQAHEQAGDHGAAARARQDYVRMLSELGLTPRSVALPLP
jgi:DNA-binding SARP family transcriptional activator